MLFFFLIVAFLCLGGAFDWFGRINSKRMATRQEDRWDVAIADRSDDAPDPLSPSQHATSNESGDNESGKSDATAHQRSSTEDSSRLTEPPFSPLIPDTSAATLAEARQVIEHMVREMPDSLEAKEIFARFEYRFGKLDHAARIWEEILTENPNFVYAMRGLGDVATEEGRLQDAVKYFRMAVLAEPSNVARQITLGVALLTAGELDEARKVLETVVRKADNNVEARVELASVLQQLEEWEEAREHLEHAVKLEPSKPEIHFALIKVYNHLGMREQAKRHLVLHRQLQRKLIEQKAEMRRAYDDLTAARIDMATFYVDMSRLYLARQALGPAATLLVRASRMDPQNVEARRALAWLAVRQGRVFDAIRWLSEVSILRPDEFTVVQEIARLYVEANQSKAALRALEQFHEAHPLHAGVLQAIVEYYLTIDVDLDQATQYARQLVETMPEATSYALLATVLQQAKDYRGAIAAFESAYQMDPENLVYLQMIAVLKDELAAYVETHRPLPTGTEENWPGRPNQPSSSLHTSP
ncbi:MAG: hypothetical protein KatS3mg111_3603 [Pirellulaceae bacterium]|nr:MAG: hypothetical protein KatS3mg111_3603 [Pirellulaceae bacterium]